MSDTTLTALVTGGNKGIGLEIARQLAQAGVFVFLGARNSKRGQAAVDDLASHGLASQTVLIDLTDPVTIEAAAEKIRIQRGKLDILVNNAGIGDPEDGLPSSSSLDAVRRSLETNFIGTLAVTQVMLPLLRKAAAARIVNLSSQLGSLSLSSNPEQPYDSMHYIGYSASKAALNMLTVELAKELRGTPIVVNSVSPGTVKTDLNGNTGLLPPETAARFAVKYALLGDAAPSGKFVEEDRELPW